MYRSLFKYLSLDCLVSIERLEKKCIFIIEPE
jgi:hypothetical protein